MRFGKDGGDPTSRHRLSAEDAHAVRREIVRRHIRGHSVREIARALSRPRTSVHRVIQDYRAQEAEQAGPDDWELDAALAYDEMTAEDVKTVEDVEACNELELYRLRHYPRDSPQRRALAGWAKMNPQPPAGARLYP